METNTEPPAVVIFADDFENHPHLALAETAAALRRSALLPTAAAAARAPLRDITHLFAPPVCVSPPSIILLLAKI